MDSVTNYILQELAFDGDLGSNVSRLQKLISQYYTIHSSSPLQTVDDKLYAFVWSILARQSTVVVGTAPGDAPAVYCPPQMSALRKGKEKVSTTAAVSLAPLPSDEIATHSLEALVAKHGSGLRIAVSPETCFVCITGSHIRPPKLSGPTYAVLQLITRSRREGMSVVEISRQSGYDSKTCFFIVKTLIELDHIYKIKVGGAAANICIYKAFYDDQCVWKQASKETAEAKADGDSLVATMAASDAENDGGEFSGNLQFEPIDNRHLSNTAVIRARLERLLQHMPNGLHVYRNLVFALGFSPSTKRERRVFTRGVLELVKLGLIEKVWVPSTHSPSGRVLCLRLKDSDSAPDSSIPTVRVAEDDAGDEPIVDNQEAEEAMMEAQVEASGGTVEEIGEDTIGGFDGTYATQSVASQIVSMIEQSGTTGMTFSELSKRLHNFDLRSITNLVVRFSEGIPPAHLTDRALVVVTENHGRERRQRVYTSAAYHTMVEGEGLQDESAAVPAETIARAGGWAVFDEVEFLKSEQKRDEWLAESVKAAFTRAGKIAKDKMGGGKKGKNPLDALGRPVIGRPRKDWGAGKGKTESGVSVKLGRPPKRKAEELEDPGVELPTKRKRGRPSKASLAEAEAQLSHDTTTNPLNDEPAAIDDTPVEVSPPKRRRPKMKQPGAIQETTSGPPGQILAEQDPGTENGGVESSAKQAPNEDPGPSTSKKSSESKKSLRRKSVPVVKFASPRRRPTAHPGSDTQTSPTRSRPPKRARLARDDTVPVGAEAEVGVESLQQSTEPAVPQPTSAIAPDELPTSSTHVSNGETLTTIPDVGGPAVVAASNATEHDVTTPTSEQVEPVQSTQANAQTAPRQNRQTNVSALRRQTEFHQVIQNLGGVVNISLSKAFSDEHQRLLQSLYSAGNAVSTVPGTEMDRRTLNSTVSALESRGLVKTRVVTSATALGATRRATIVYLTGASPESVEECVEAFRQTGSMKGVPIPNDFPQLSEGVAYGEKGKSFGNRALSVTPVASPAPEPALDPLSVARNEHLSEAKTAAQHVGYIVGRFARARTLHLRLLSELATDDVPPTLVSPGSRVFSKEYFFEDIPISTFCAIVPQGIVFPELRTTLDTEQGKETRIRNASTAIQSHLRPSSSASKTQIQTVLSILLNLACLVPVRVELDPVTKVTNYIDTTADAQWDYLRVPNLVPVYRYADKDHVAPLCYHYEVSSPESGVLLWERLQNASHPSTCLAIEISEPGPPYSGDPSLLKSIRRFDNWKADYALSTSQNNYLYDFVNQATGTTPLDDPSSTRFDEACFVTSAPAKSVSDFFSRARTSIQQDLERIRLKAQKHAEEQRKAAEEAKSALAAKAAQAKMALDRRWELLVGEALEGRLPPHVQLQKAVSSLKAEYILAPQPVNNSTWEAKIREAVRNSLGAKQFVIAPLMRSRAGASPESSVLGNSQQTQDISVASLILQQGAPIQQKDIAPKKSGRKSKIQLENAREESPPASESESRRRRFPWNPEYDELARDAGAIIRVRCRSSKRMDWSALEQVFPGVQRNSVRQRISTLGDLPGATGYYQRLDNAWAALWLQHRGSDQLPDPNPESLNDFDLAAHITFLRQHIDKAALHAGAEAQNTTSTKSSFTFNTLEELFANYDVAEVEAGSQPTTWDFCFDISSEEPREREFLQNSFIIPPDAVSYPSESATHVHVAQAAIKMTMSTPENMYNSEDASAMLTLLGEGTIKTAVNGMTDSLDMKKRGNKNKPGRKYTYSDFELTRLKGDFASSMYPDALSMREHLESLEAGEWRNVELTDEDGEVAAYLQLVSDNKLEIAIDTSVPEAGRQQLGWQSKRVDDENLEAQIAIRLAAKEAYNLTSNPTQIDSDPEDLELPLGSSEYSCTHVPPEEIICQECLRDAERSVAGSEAKTLAEIIHDAGPLGLPIPRITELFNTNAGAIQQSLRNLSRSSPPLVHVLGYDQARIVSAFELDEWTVKVIHPAPGTTEPKFKSVFPRRWLDIHGSMIEDIWTTSVRTVASALMYRPSISEHALRRRYRGLFDRQELNDILVHLMDSGKLKRSPSRTPVGMLSLEDEMNTYWSLANESRWF